MNKKMNKKGQGAMEYLMTYGWAILVVLIVGIVLWQLGIFGGLGGGANKSTGFSGAKIGIIDGTIDCGDGTLTVQITNQAGSSITGIVAAVSEGCTTGTPTSDTLAAGAKTTLTLSTCTPTTAGVIIQPEVVLTFNETVAGSTIGRSQTGRIVCTNGA